MANKRITDLTAATTLSSSDVFPFDNATPNTRKITASNAAKALLALAADGGNVATSESTSSTSYTDLTTTGPSVTLTTGTSVLIGMSTQASKTSAGAGNSGFISVNVSGATTLAASDANGQSTAAPAQNFGVTIARVIKLTGLTAGSNTFKLQYRCDGGTWAFSNRSIIVLAI